MKNSKNKIFKAVSTMLVVFAFVCTANLNAQGIPPGGETNTLDNHQNQGVPLDGGMAAVIIGAAAFGIKKLRDHNKNNVA